MGLFSPKISQQELQRVQSALGQIEDSIHLINTTTKPEVFFKRLNFTLDLLLELQRYEKYNIFKASTPTKDYKKIINNMEATVNDFIDRAVSENNSKVSTLKTDAARERNKKDFAAKLMTAFDKAHTFWSGNFSQSRTFPHYSGPLFTPANYKRVQAMCHIPSSVSVANYCTHCGAKVASGDKFCTKCGSKL